MLQEYPKEELQKIYEDLPDDLSEALFSQESANAISDICDKNGIEEKEVVSKLVGYTLLGLLPLDEFEKTLEEELKLNNSVAKNVVKEIISFVFYPVKESLEALYKTAIEKPTPKATSTQRRGKDAYREPTQ